jgi:beta-glucosidase-like glycosyl hydrolase
LSAQVLPQELKNRATTRLLNVKDTVGSFNNVIKYPILERITKQQIQDNINYLQARDLSHLWPEFVEFNRKLDATRNQGPLESVVPEFAPYV